MSYIFRCHIFFTAFLSPYLIADWLFAVIIMPHRKHAAHKMRPIATYIARSVVCLSVCVCVGHPNVPCKNGWTDRVGVGVADSGWHKEPCITWSRSPRKGAILGVVRPTEKHWESLLRCTQQKRSISARHMMRPFVKIPWPLLSSGTDSSSAL